MHEEAYDAETDTLASDITRGMLRMGVTTALGGNCGECTVEPRKYLDLVDRDGSAVNMGMFAGHTWMRQAAGHGDKYSAIREEELRRIETLAQENLEQGCFGVSFGIRYVPGITEEEMLRTAQACKAGKKLVTAHVRNDADYIFSAVEELFAVGRKLDIPVQNSHVGSMAGFGQMERVLALMDAYRAGGMDITGDCYPYYAFSTRIGETTYDDGFRDRYGADYSAIEICEGKYKGRRCDEEIFRELRRDHPETLTVCYVMKEEDVDMALLHPAVMVASDGLIDSGQGHPRAGGTFPRFLRRYAGNGRISLYDALEKMTALPAKKQGIWEKARTRIW